MTTTRFRSSLERPALLQQLSNTQYDLVVIGGGITGAGIALDAASRGMKVALVEKNDFASGTSSRSTKLIHGGLRYLKQFEINLVREVGSERATVHRLAPHIVTAEKMLLPLIEGGTYGKMATSFGLMVYDFLAGVSGDDKRVMLSKEETLAEEKLLKEEVVKGGGLYAEYRTDDARLTIEIIKKAAEYGANSINYVKATDFIYENGKVRGINCTDLTDNLNFSIQSKYVVSAAGPWVDQLRKINKSLFGKHLFLSKGVHIVVPHDKLPVKHAVYFDVPDGRMIFAIPRHRVTYIGTTDTPYKDDINHVLTNTEDVDYLVKAVNNTFPTVNLKNEDVESSWAGLRPLIHEEGKSASEISRKDEIFISDTNLISIAGGKLTGYRKMAERVVDEVVDQFKEHENKSFKKCHTDQIPLTDAPFKDAEEVNVYLDSIKNSLVSYDLDAYIAKYLVANYGKSASSIIDKMANYDNESEIALARAELAHTIEQELVQTPLDFFTRRTGRLFFNLPSIAPVKESILEDFKSLFNWSDEKLQQERNDLDQAIYEAANFEYSSDAATIK